MRIDSFIWFLDFCVKNCFSSLNARISTIDNPGFYLKVNLEKTGLGNKLFSHVEIDRSEHDWIRCFIRDKNFEGICGPTNLSEVLRVFHDWVNNNQFQGPEFALKDNEVLQWLEIWYSRQCDGDWEHENGVEVQFLPDSTSHLLIELKGTSFEEEDFTNVSHRRSQSDWLECFIKDKKFNGVCYPLNLPEALSIFRQWSDQYQKNFSEFFAYSELFKKRSNFRQAMNISEWSEKIKELLKIVTSNRILNIIPFYDHLHFVFENGVSFNCYTRTIASKPLSTLKGLTILRGDVKHLAIHLELEDSQFLEFDLEYIFDGAFIGIELHAPQRYVVSESDWIPPAAGQKTWTLFLE